MEEVDMDFIPLGKGRYLNPNYVMRCERFVQDGKPCVRLLVFTRIGIIYRVIPRPFTREVIAICRKNSLPVLDVASLGSNQD